MLRQAPPPGPVHLALSGGGIRAALFSAGALIAVTEAEQDRSPKSTLAKYQGAGEVNVASTTAVSGSSLLLGRLILQGSAGSADAVARLRRETADLWRYGFRRRWPVAFVLSILWSLVLLSLFFAAARWDRNQYQLIFDDNAADIFSYFEKLRLWPEAFWVLLVAAVMLLLYRRSNGFVLDIRSGLLSWKPFPRYRALWREGSWKGAANKRDDATLIPGGDVRLVTTNLSEQTVHLWDPWDPPRTRFGAASLHHLAKASSAFPIYSSGVQLNGAPNVDGGVLDNLGVSHALHQPDGWILSLDCSLPGDAATPLPLKQGLGRAVVYVAAVLATTTALALAVRSFVPLEWRQIAAGLLTAAVVIAGLRALLGTAAGELRLTANELANEWTALAAMQAQQRDYLYTSLVAHGRPYRAVRLTDGRQFSQPGGRAQHDLTTKLSPLAPDSGREVIRQGYRGTCHALGRVETDETIRWINGLQPSLGRRLVRRLGLGRLARALRRVFVMRF